MKSTRTIGKGEFSYWQCPVCCHALPMRHRRNAWSDDGRYFEICIHPCHEARGPYNVSKNGELVKVVGA